MLSAAAAQSDAIWLRTGDYQVAPLNSRVLSRVSELKRALESGLPAYPDTSRSNFYDVELPNG